MIKLVTFQKRVSQLSRSQFEERWRTIHGPVAAAFPGLRGYMLGFSLDDGEPPADGIAQLWFDSREACQESYASEIGRSGSADATAWLARREHLLASEKWIDRKGPLSSTPFKLVFCVKRNPAQERADFIEWLSGEPVETVSALTGADQLRLSLDEAGQLLNSRVEGDLSLVFGEAPYDAMIECWFADLDAARAARKQVAAWKGSLAEITISRWEDALLHEHIVVMPPPPAYGQEQE